MQLTSIVCRGGGLPGAGTYVAPYLNHAGCVFTSSGFFSFLFFFFFFWWGLLHSPQQGPDRMKEKTYKTGKRKTSA